MLLRVETGEIDGDEGRMTGLEQLYGEGCTCLIVGNGFIFAPGIGFAELLGERRYEIRRGESTLTLQLIWPAGPPDLRQIEVYVSSD